MHDLFALRSKLTGRLIVDMHGSTRGIPVLIFASAMRANLVRCVETRFCFGEVNAPSQIDPKLPDRHGPEDMEVVKIADQRLVPLKMENLVSIHTLPILLDAKVKRGRGDRQEWIQIPFSRKGEAALRKLIGAQLGVYSIASDHLLTVEGLRVTRVGRKLQLDLALVHG